MAIGKSHFTPPPGDFKRTRKGRLTNEEKKIYKKKSQQFFKWTKTTFISEKRVTAVGVSTKLQKKLKINHNFSLEVDDRNTSY